MNSKNPITVSFNGKRSISLKPKIFKFPGGEVQVSLGAPAFECPIASAHVVAHLRTTDDVMALLLVTDAIRRVMPVPIDLHLPYVPYARQDRACNPGEALSAKVFCSLINAQNYRSVQIFDPHSDVVPALLDRVIVQDVTTALVKVLEHPIFANGVTLIAPDAGAQKRVMKVAKAFNIEHVICADKVRDTKTGQITGMSISAAPEPGRPALVVDDICDGGATFVGLAQLKELQDVDLCLYVSHGIFSRGVDVLAGHYKHVFAGYDWTGSTRDFLTTIFKD